MILNNNLHKRKNKTKQQHDKDARHIKKINTKQQHGKDARHVKKIN